MENLRKKMAVCLEGLLKDFGGLRTGRASVSFLDNIMVEAYGGAVQLQQVGTINVPEARLITIQVWDKSLLKPTESAIRNSNMGLNPVVDGQLIRIVIPELSEERRREICKLASKYAEQTRISVRNIRRDGMDDLKKREKAKEITEDDGKKMSDDIQKLTNEFTAKVDSCLEQKEQEIMKV
ncbi:MAG: ribosome recycling factor [Holosporaceae bacterium]|jgi:ribosome recycling factor|nr:ribosome recycling factor [Holosporaceae bacterium]